MRHASMSFYLSPPYPAVTNAHAIHVQGFGDDHMIDTRRREPTALCKIVNATIAAGLLASRSRAISHSRQFCPRIDEGFDRDDGRRESALHVAGASAVDFAVADQRGKGVQSPAPTGLHHIDMAVEVHAGPCTIAFASRNDIDARIAIGIAGSSLRAH